VSEIRKHLEQIARKCNRLIVDLVDWNHAFPSEIRQPVDVSELVELRAEVQRLNGELDEWERS
jgi:hypothetical protein